MGTYTIKSFNEILNDMTAYILANAPQITDLSPGSIIRSFCEASALSLEELYVEAYLGFQRALSTVAPDKFNFPRKTGTYSQGNVVFSAASATLTAITIPSGTRVQDAAGLTWATTAVGTIPQNGTTSPPVPVQAAQTGAIYNVNGATDAISMLDNVNGVVSVAWYNSIGPTGGTNEESDFQYQSRFQAYIEGLAGSNISGLIAAALSVQGVTSASVYENIPPVSNINAYLYIDNGSTVGAPKSLVAQVQTLINGSTNFLNLAIWASTTTYGVGDVVVYNGQGYTSLLANNLNNLPTGTTALWSSIVTYPAGAAVLYSGVEYISQQASNLNNIPPTSPAYWQVGSYWSTLSLPLGNPGYRAAGVNVQVLAASVVAINVVVTVLPTSVNIPTNVISSDVVTAVTNYVNALGAAQNVEYYAVASACMGVYGVQNISGLTLNGGGSDITISSGQVGRVNSVSVTVS